MQTSSVTSSPPPPIQPTKHIEVAANGSDIHGLSIADTNFQHTFCARNQEIGQFCHKCCITSFMLHHKMTVDKDVGNCLCGHHFQEKTFPPIMGRNRQLTTVIA